MDIRQIHIPVSLERSIELLEPALSAPHAVLVDATLGMAGHAEAFLNHFPQLRLIGIDRDTDALRIAGERLAPFSDRIELVHAVYDEITDVLERLATPRVSGFLFDLGVSSLQLDRAERGFAYAQDAPLDMRMDQTTGITAADAVATLTADELASIFRRFGDEKLAPRYARAIVDARSNAPIETSGQLVDILQKATPAALMNAGHPAKRVFQALRIHVNEELAVLHRAIPQALKATSVGGRVVVLSYQSLEDRIVKAEFAEVTTDGTPAGVPVGIAALAPTFRLLTRGAELASDEEKAANPRATPVRIRAVERVRDAA
jgi:16S rRNA (cytosine1402-N4)-methyltransferase